MLHFNVEFTTGLSETYMGRLTRTVILTGQMIAGL